MSSFQRSKNHLKKKKLTDVEINRKQKYSEKTLVAGCCTQVIPNLLERQTERMHNDTPTMHNIEN